ncbi:MAG: heterodisulfide reductase-related iron-sulfur binding cluster, partial [Bacteroidales bacterium]|nr:heterodisulfide reductase-related iron-sulfur binding cluster [Bacteroidales bacterium]
NKYNKEIAEDNYYYLRSCIRQNFFPGAEKVFIDIMRNKLNKDICDDQHHTTCTGIGYHSDIVPYDTFQVMVARQFSLMTEKGYKNAAVSCITSFGGYNEVLETWKEFPEEEARARQNLKTATGKSFNKPENLTHCCDIIYKFRDEIAQQVKYKLINQKTGLPLKIVDHIGCHYAKIFPEKGVGGAEYSTVLTGLIDAWGGQQVNYPEKRHCCGFGFRQYLIKNNRSYSISNAKKKFVSMEPYKPDAIVTNCPGCNMFLDRWQYALAQIEGKTFGGGSNGIPVLSQEELAGLVLGYDPWDIGLQMHQVDLEPLLKKMGVVYDPEKKYIGINKKQLKTPEFTGCFNH